MKRKNKHETFFRWLAMVSMVGALVGGWRLYGPLQGFVLAIFMSICWHFLLARLGIVTALGDATTKIRRHRRKTTQGGT